MNKGFIALIVVLLTTGILLGLVSSSSIESILFFDEAMRKEYRAMNHFYAYNCLDQAILALAHDYFYTITSPVAIPELRCSIISISSSSTQRTIVTRGDFQKAYSYRTATVDMGIHSLNAYVF